MTRIASAAAVRWWSLLILLVLPEQVFGTPAYLPPGAVVFFDTYTGLSSCPTGFTPAPSVLHGFVIIGDPTGLGTWANTTNGVPPLVSGTEPLHSHSGGSGICTSNVASTPTGPSTTCGSSGTDWMINTPICNSASPGSTTSDGSGYGFVQLVACLNTYPTATPTRFTVDTGAVVYMDAGNSLCPSDWEPFDDANGRTIVAADPALSQMTNPSTRDYFYYGYLSDVPPLNSITGETLHNHSFYSTTSLPASAFTAPGAAPTVNAIASPTPSITVQVSGTLTPAPLGIPLKALRACATRNIVSSDNTTSQLLPMGSILFFAAQTGCPSENYWTQVPNYYGRLISIAPSSFPTSGLIFGSSNLLATATVSGTGPSHTHSGFASGKVQQGTTCGTDMAGNSASSATPTFIVGRTGGGIQASIASNSTASPSQSQGSIPFVALVLCRRAMTTSPTRSPSVSKPTASPTLSKPTKSPSTSSPSKSPSSAKPSRSPSQSPTSSKPSSSPSSSPTHSRPSYSPSRSPSRSPSSSPTTQTPTRSPTTRSPSRSPSKSPASSRPSRSPSSSPTTQTPTRSPTTKSPTTSPSTAPQTSRPSRSPSQSPIHRPTALPSKSPTVSAPTFSPSRSPSRSPYSAWPSVSPTRLPSKSPSTTRPTSSPSTLRPTASPTRRPTPLPTGSPTTTRPTASPSTSKPQLSPSKAPVVSHPSSSPSASRPTAAPTFTGQTRTPTSSRPTTLIPTKSPTLSRPTASPIQPAAASQAGAIAGGVIGGLLALFGLAALIVFRRRLGLDGKLKELQEGLGGAIGGPQPPAYPPPDHKRRTVQSFFNYPKYFHGRTAAPPAAIPPPPGIPPPPPGLDRPAGPGQPFVQPPPSAAPLVRNPMYAATELPPIRPPGMTSVQQPLDPLAAKNPMWDGPSPPTSPLNKTEGPWPSSPLSQV